jgi:hypothetical protein
MDEDSNDMQNNMRYANEGVEGLQNNGVSSEIQMMSNLMQNQEEGYMLPESSMNPEDDGRL